MPVSPPRIRPGDRIRIVAPSRSLGILSADVREGADARLRALGFVPEVAEGAAHREGPFDSAPADVRLADLHTAFADPGVRGILTGIGGFGANALLDDLDYARFERNPKILCGYSDITGLLNAVFARTGVVTYLGPHSSTFAMRREFEFTERHFLACVGTSDAYELGVSSTWSDDAWFLDQDRRELHPNPGWEVLQPGEAEGTIVGGNLSTFQLLLGTPYLPSLRGTVLFLEEDDLPGEDTAACFDRGLQSVLQQPGSDGIRGLVIGRFQKRSQVTLEQLRHVVSTKKRLRGLPVVAGVDFGHTSPLLTLPIGGTGRLSATAGDARFTVLTH